MNLEEVIVWSIFGVYAISLSTFTYIKIWKGT